MKTTRTILIVMAGVILMAGNILAQTAHPVFDTIDHPTIHEGENLNFVVIATDADGTIPLLSVYGLPDGADFVVHGDGTGTFDWTPDYTQHALYPVTFLAVDAVTPPDCDTMRVDITVLDVDVPPVLDSIGNKTCPENDSLGFYVTASDPDGTIPALSTSTRPSGASFTDFLDGTGEFSWIPDYWAAGVYQIIFFASDGEYIDSEIVEIVVPEANAPPVLDSIGDKIVAEGANLNFQVTASDPYDFTTPVLTVSALPTNAWFMDFNDGTGIFNFDPDYTQSGWYAITFYATDDSAAVDSEMIYIEVTNTNRPPVLDSIGYKIVAEGANLSFVVTASDPDGTIPQLSTTALPTNAWFVDNLDGTGLFNFDPDYTQSGWFAITFNATDEWLYVDSEMIYIEVTNAGGTLIVTSLADTGEGSLRYAIDLANANIQEDTIVFEVSGTILLRSSLMLTDDRPTQILGATAPGGARSVVLDGQLGVPIGFEVASIGNLIRDLVLVNFDDYAIVMTPELGPNTIAGCYINVDASGTVRGTRGGGVAVIGSLNACDIGGPTESDRNVIAGGGGNPAIYIYQSDRVWIFGNYIGLAASGTEPLANPVLTEAGIHIVESSNIMIGEIFPGYGNIISGNFTGIRALGSLVNVGGNYIGLDRQGNPLGNGSSGIRLEDGSAVAVISNTIAFNGGNGIEVLGNSSSENRFTGNEIYENGLLAIDLGGDGVTLNDPGDGDTGPNGLYNFPEIDSINSLLDGTYEIYGRAGANSQVEIFVAHPAGDSTRPADPSGYGEAYAFLGTTFALPEGEFSFVTDLSVAPFSLLSCTATDPLGNTSEMSDNFRLLPRPLILVAYGSAPPGRFQDVVNIIIEDPEGNRFGKDSLGNIIDEIPGAEYWETPNDSVIIPDPLIGEYVVDFVGVAGAPEGATYAAIIKIDGTQQATIVADETVPSSGQTNSATYTYDEGYHYVNGNANSDAVVNVADAVFIIAYVFKSGAPPDPYLAGDADCNLTVDVSDAVYIVSYVFKGGDPPGYFEP